MQRTKRDSDGVDTKFSATVVASEVANNNRVVTPKVSRINVAVSTKVIPLRDQIRNGISYVFQHNTTLRHNVEAYRAGMQASLYRYVLSNIKPSRSQDLSQIDYYIWGVVER